jgi:hypothetical protein
MAGYGIEGEAMRNTWRCAQEDSSLCRLLLTQGHLVACSDDANQRFTSYIAVPHRRSHHQLLMGACNCHGRSYGEA